MDKVVSIFRLYLKGLLIFDERGIPVLTKFGLTAFAEETASPPASEA
jgi:hypothetical protein